MNIIIKLGLSIIVSSSVSASPLPVSGLAAATADPQRAADRPIDVRRKPEEVVSFSGVKVGDKVVDLIPGSGYFTRIFSKIVGPQGHVFMIWPIEYGRVAHSDVVSSRKLASTPRYGNVSVVEQPTAAFATPAPVDVVFTAQNYHDYQDEFMGQVGPTNFARAVYAALKPGGTFVIIDHVAEPGSGMRDTEKRHRIDPAIVRQQVTSVGFVFDGSVSVLRNLADNHLKPVFDPSIRGHTDQFVYRFRKPASHNMP